MKDVEQVIHAAADANFQDFTYTKVYASSAATPTINGTAIGMVAGISLGVLVQSISATADVFVIGYRKLKAPKVING